MGAPRCSHLHPRFSTALRGVPKLITITPMVLLYQSSVISIILKAGQNALLGCDTLLKLTHLCLHCTSSQTLLAVPSNQNTFCWCTWNPLKMLQTLSINHCHLLCHGQKHTPATVLRWAITLLSHGDMMLMVALQPTYKTLRTTCFRCMKSTNRSSIGSRSKEWIHTITSHWSTQTPLCFPQASKTELASRSSLQHSR